jgi:hypothetical protein
MENLRQYNVSFRRELMLALGQLEEQRLGGFHSSTEASEDYIYSSGNFTHLIRLNLNGPRLIIKLTTFHITLFLSSVGLNEINVPNALSIAGFSSALS